MSAQSKDPIPLTRRKPVLLSRAEAQQRVAVPTRRDTLPHGQARRSTGEIRLNKARLQHPAPRTRVYPRWPNLVQVSLESEHNFFCGFFREVGSCGLFVATYTAVPLGEVMLVSFTVPGHAGAFNALSEVRWIREHSDRTEEVAPGVGFGFLRIDADSMQAVQRFMTMREPVFWEG